MGFFSAKCKECKTKSKIQLCPYCKKDICFKCLSLLVLRDKTPEWFVGKKVKMFEEYKQFYSDYCSQFRGKGINIHCCDSYLRSSWSAIVEKVKKMEKDGHVKAKFIILK